MKFLLYLLITTLLAASPVMSQMRKAKQSKAKRQAQAEKRIEDVAAPNVSYDEPPPPPPVPKPKTAGNGRLSSNVFQDVSIRKWGVTSLSVPDDLMSESESEKQVVGKNTTWTTYSRFWQQANVNFPEALKVSLTATTWDADFKAIVPELRPDLATPEHFILIDLLGDINSKNKPDSFVKEAKPMAVGGVDGSFFRADAAGDDNRFMAGWQTYRYYEGKAQRISVTVTGRKVELEKALKIIESLKFQ